MRQDRDINSLRIESVLSAPTAVSQKKRKRRVGQAFELGGAPTRVELGGRKSIKFGFGKAELIDYPTQESRRGKSAIYKLTAGCDVELGLQFELAKFHGDTDCKLYYHPLSSMR
jgi:hypothetical protein